MNKIMLVGRLTRNPNVSYSSGENSICVSRYTLAVDRRFKRDGEQNADFISCVAFGRQGEFAEKYLKQGTKIAITGRIQTGSYMNRDGQKVYTTDVVIEEQEFAESKASSQSYVHSYNNGNSIQKTSVPLPVGEDDFMIIPEGVEEELPFI